MTYVDGWLSAVPKNRVEDYQKLASKAAEIWKEYGALTYVESVADELKEGEHPFFPTVSCKEDETVIFSWITYKSREDKEEVNAKALADPRLHEAYAALGGDMPVDLARIISGSFKPIVGL